LYSDDAQLTPAANLDVEAVTQMAGMTDGAVIQRARPSGDGHYVLPMQFSMEGTWLVTLRVAGPGTSQQSIPLQIGVWR
jgi:hypothetical protein